MGQYRNELQIIADILFIARRSATKTQIMYQANLSHKLLCRYLSKVLESDLVCREDSTRFALTDKGQDFLERYGEYSKLRKSMQEHLNKVEDQRAKLEIMCSGAGVTWRARLNQKPTFEAIGLARQATGKMSNAT